MGDVIEQAHTSEKIDNNSAMLKNAHDVVEYLTWKMVIIDVLFRFLCGQR